MTGSRFLILVIAAIWTVPAEAQLFTAPSRTGERSVVPFADLVEVVERSRGDEDDEIETDRDSFTPATTTAGRRRVIVESAWSFIDNRHVPDTHSLPELVTRYGVNDWLELRLGWNYEVGGAPNVVSSNTADPEDLTESGIERDSQIFYGLKASLTEQDGFRPQSAVIVQAGTPTSGLDTATQMFATYVVGRTFAKGWKWDTAMRYGFDSSEGDHFNVWAPSTVLKVPLGERWAVHGEYFGVFSQGRVQDGSQSYFSPGIHFLATPNLEVGTRVGWGLNEQAAAFFANFGVGWRY